MSFTSEQLAYANGALLDEFGSECGLVRFINESDLDFRRRIMTGSILKSATGLLDGGSAFPEPGSAQCGGMTLRDYFAAKALPVAWQAFENGYFDSAEESINANVATCAYQMADAMLAARGESK